MRLYQHAYTYRYTTPIHIYAYINTLTSKCIWIIAPKYLHQETEERIMPPSHVNVENEMHINALICDQITEEDKYC